MTEKIKQCVFCGSDSVKVTGRRSGDYKRNGTLYQVMCNKCKARGPAVKGNDGDYDSKSGSYIGGDETEYLRYIAIAQWELRAK